MRRSRAAGTHRLVKVRRYRGTRTPSGTMIKNAMDASRAWSLTVFSYPDRGRDRDIAMVKEGIPSQSRRGCLAHAVGLAHTNPLRSVIELRARETPKRHWSVTGGDLGLLPPPGAVFPQYGQGRLSEPVHCTPCYPINVTQKPLKPMKP